MPFASQRVEIFEDVFSAGNVGRFAFDFQIVVDQLGVNAQAAFQKPDVLISGAKEAFNASQNTHASFHWWGGGYLRSKKKRFDRKGSNLGQPALAGGKEPSG